MTNQSLSPNNWRIEIHTAKWRWKRILCILCQLVVHWTKPHLDDVSYGQTNTKFIAGKAVLSRSEIARLDKKIQECLLKLYSKNDNYRFSQNECEYEQTQDSEFDSQDVDESFYDESSGSKDSEETDYENDSQFSDSESD